MNGIKHSRYTYESNLLRKSGILSTFSSLYGRVTSISPWTWKRRREKNFEFKFPGFLHAKIIWELKNKK